MVTVLKTHATYQYVVSTIQNFKCQTCKPQRSEGYQAVYGL